MTDRGTIAIIHEKVPTDAPQDVQDVLVQVRSVAEACEALGFAAVSIAVDINLQALIDAVRAANPVVVFNLVESLNGHTSLIHLAPSVLECHNIPYTGSDSYALQVTTSKILTKQHLDMHHIKTPAWQTVTDIIANGPVLPFPCILKPIAEDGSCGIDDSCVCISAHLLAEKIDSMESSEHLRYFAEHYIEGREFNVGLLADDSHVEVLPIAEMKFIDYPPHKPRILNYASKWASDAFEYGHTVRSFVTSGEERPLLDEMGKISIQCWRKLDLSGFVRVDFRVDAQGCPWVLEVNANPCISPDSGFVASVQEAGYSYSDMVKRIVTAARKKS